MNRRVALVVLLVLAARVLSALVITGPGYTDAYYYTNVASRLASGGGLTADFVWSPLEADGLALPVSSHLFWVPLPTVLGAAGIALLGGVLGAFRSAQIAVVLVALLIPVVTFLAARRLGVREQLALIAAAIAGLGGLFAPGLVDVDAYAPAAVLGTLFFVAYARAADGDARAGAAAGVLVGALYLARSEGALFGLALLALALTSRSRRAGLAGALVALAIGAAWVARDAAAGMPPDIFARTALLVRYSDFFAIAAPTWSAFAADPGAVVGAKASALGMNLATLVLTFAAVLLVPLGAGLSALRSRADVRAWAALLVLVYLAQSLVWTLHSVRGSYFHSLAAFFPFGVAVAAAGAERLLASREPRAAAAWGWGAVVLVAAISYASVAQWVAVFDPIARERAAAVDAIPDGPFLAVDAAAWRYLSGRPVIVTPSDGLGAAGCYVARFGARAIVVEPVHFAAYDELYRGTRPDWLGAPTVRSNVTVYPVVSSGPVCAKP